jgi:hypothetical protein
VLAAAGVAGYNHYRVAYDVLTWPFRSVYPYGRLRLDRSWTATVLRSATAAPRANWGQ